MSSADALESLSYKLDSKGSSGSLNVRLLKRLSQTQVVDDTMRDSPNFRIRPYQRAKIAFCTLSRESDKGVVGAIVCQCQVFH